MHKINLCYFLTVYQSGFIRHSPTTSQILPGDSWVVLSEIESRIKSKIEAIGVPLKDWDIQINYGIKTGYNEAFILDGKRKDELIRQDPKSVEIIRPILRGRDIKKYSYEFADLWLINTHNGLREKGVKPVNVEHYPAVKAHLNKFFPELEKRLDKGITPYNLRNCAYMDDFNRQKIVWIELADKGRFAYDYKDNYLTLNGTFIMIGNQLDYLCCILNNPITSWHFNTFCISSGVGTNQWRELYVRELLIPQFGIETRGNIIELFNLIISENDKSKIFETQKKLDHLVYEALELTMEEIEFIELQ